MRKQTKPLRGTIFLASLREKIFCRFVSTFVFQFCFFFSSQIRILLEEEEDGEDLEKRIMKEDQEDRDRERRILIQESMFAKASGMSEACWKR